MAAMAILVTLTSLVTGFLGTALLRSYLYSRSDTQLRDFAAVASRILERSHVPVAQNGQLPAQFLVELVSADGKVLTQETPPHATAGPRLSAAQLRDNKSPFTAAAAGSPGHSWRVLVVPLSGGRHAIIAFSLDDLNSTVTPLDRRHVDLASIAAQAVQAARIVNPGRPVTLLAGDPAIVYADTERLRQVIDNLIGNAIQHTPPQSTVTVSVTDTTGTGQITVADNGPGMTADQAAHVFERFYRTDGARTRACGGTGLGLSIAASLAAAHGGDITVDTKPGQGATFHLRLPLAASVESET
jgi:hypothetical protein